MEGRGEQRGAEADETPFFETERGKYELSDTERTTDAGTATESQADRSRDEERHGGLSVPA